MVENFSQSLRYGNQFIYQSMPRMLSLWLDYGAEVSEQEKKSKNPTTIQGMRNYLSQLNTVSAKLLGLESDMYTAQ